jgi:hypothetical protein
LEIDNHDEDHDVDDNVDVDDALFADMEPYEVHYIPNEIVSSSTSHDFALVDTSTAAPNHHGSHDHSNFESGGYNDTRGQKYPSFLDQSHSYNKFSEQDQGLMFLEETGQQSLLSCSSPAPLPFHHNHVDSNSTGVHNTSDDKERDMISCSGEIRFREFHEKKWNDHLQQLREFKKMNGHCLVPHTFPENQSLARWVKRQRRQFKLMQDGDKSSTMTQARVELLNQEGFVWDSHDAVWNERYEQLVRYKEEHGHCRVPSYCKKYPQLATWVKCQRRQYKLFWEGKRSSMSAERTRQLDNIGFVWEVRTENKCSDMTKEDSLKKLAEILSDL